MDKLTLDINLAKDLFEILDSFNYEPDEDSCMGMSYFKARLSEDWFFITKNNLKQKLEELEEQNKE